VFGVANPFITTDNPCVLRKYSPNGKVLKRVTLPPVPGFYRARLVFTVSGELYAGTGNLYRFDAGNLQWKQIQCAVAARAPYARVVGTDADDLVFHAWRNYPPRLLWVRPRE